MAAAWVAIDAAKCDAAGCDAPAIEDAVQQTMAGSAPSRIHYLDNLRALAMLLGVFLHSAFAYAAPSQTFWLVTDPDASVPIDVAIWLIHLFRMSLFFFLSGYFASLTIGRKGAVAFMTGRLLRIVGPFLLFYPLLLVSTAAVIVFAMAYIEEPRGLLGLISDATRGGNPNAIDRTPTTMHLWFLYYLLMFNIISAVASRMPWPKVSLVPTAWTQWLWLPLLLVPGLLGAGVPTPAPESFIPAWWPLCYFGLFYAAGWQLKGRERSLEQLCSARWVVLGASLLLFVVYYLSMPVMQLTSLDAIRKTPDWGAYPTATLCTAYLSVSLTGCALLFGLRHLSNRSPFLAFLADASYWTYLVHLPIVLFLQTLFVPLPFLAEFKCMLVLVITLVACMATYLVFVRYTPIGWLLHGKRSFP
jgi:glucans biosynthesis protein C